LALPKVENLMTLTRKIGDRDAKEWKRESRSSTRGVGRRFSGSRMCRERDTRWWLRLPRTGDAPVLQHGYVI
jgi:hypothetical protein